MALIKDIFEREGVDIVRTIQSKLSSTGANATGKTSASLELEASDTRLIVTGGKAFNTNYRDGLSYVAGGRGRGGVPPYDAIKEWAYARGLINRPEGEKRIVDAIRFKIAREGTDIWKKNTPRDIYQTTITDERIANIYDEINGVFADKVLSEVIKNLNTK